MTLPSDVMGVAPWVVLTAVVSWVGALYAGRAKARKDAIDHADRLEVHRDELTLSVVRMGREELAAARIEVDDLRNEVKKLRALETHFFHFQQSLDHLEALLTAETPEQRASAERNARAFLN